MYSRIYTLIQIQTVQGPTVHFFRANNWAPDNWAPGPNCPGPNCSGAQLSGAQLSGAQLSGAQLSRAQLSGAQNAKMPPDRLRGRSIGGGEESELGGLAGWLHLQPDRLPGRP